MQQTLALTLLISVALISVALAQTLRARRRSEEVVARWRALCASLTGQALLTREGRAPWEWRLLRARCLPAEGAEGDGQGESLAPRWVPLGGNAPPLLCVSDLPAPLSLLPPLSAWALVIPSLSTMLGIIGTFYGIQLGLHEAELDRFMVGEGGSAQMTGLMEGAGELFSAMTFAFVTSLGGLSAALVTTAAAAAGRQGRARAARELAALQERHFVTQSAARSVEQSVARLGRALAEARAEQARATAALQRRVDELARLQLLKGSELQGRLAELQRAVSDRGAQQELVAELVVQIDDLLTLRAREEEAP